MGGGDAHQSEVLFCLHLVQSGKGVLNRVASEDTEQELLKTMADNQHHEDQVARQTGETESCGKI